MEAFLSIISDKLGSFFDLTFHNLCPNKRPPIFGESGSVTTVCCDSWETGVRMRVSVWIPDAEGPTGCPGED
jgi:hypothetical protein